eukprot:3297591-Amphidinium_carterae.2
MHVNASLVSAGLCACAEFENPAGACVTSGHDNVDSRECLCLIMKVCRLLGDDNQSASHLCS